MVFNSFAFICAFLPLGLAGFSFLAGKTRSWALAWLLLLSLVFYGLWDWRALPLLLLSITVNYGLSRAIAGASGPRRRWLLIAAIVFDLGLLGFFKYANFFLSTLASATGLDLPVLAILLPIGISFFTFTQIAFIVDTYQHRANMPTLAHYLLFASYFPYIVAGPILHHGELLEQLTGKDSLRPRLNDLTSGLSLFVFGLAKKLLIADNLAAAFTPLFHQDNPQFLHAWLGMFAYTLQLYFDFSGYTDMAVGVSRMFGLQLPINFNSPYKAVNVSDFWQRWHISLSRFLRNYLYIPLGGNRCGQFNRYRNLLLTMLLGGLWHGANWTFVVWGGLHGLYLCVQHGWQHWVSGRCQGRSPIPPWLGRVITFVAVLVAWCFFRAPDTAAALSVLAGMAGANGLAAVSTIDGPAWALLAAAALVAFALPNSGELLLFTEKRYREHRPAPSLPTPPWAPTLRWGMALGVLLALALLSLEKSADFIYAQF